MRKHLTALSAGCLFLVSCQKEISLEPGTSGTNGVRLYRIGTRLGTDSITTDYSYNNANSLTGYMQKGTYNGKAVDLEIRLIRNSSNLRTSVVTKSNLFSQFGVDSLVYYYGYDAATSRYQYARSTITAFGDTYTDSISYHYNGSGQLTSAVDWEDEGAGYVPYSKEEFTYSGANIATYKTYLYDDINNKFDLDSESSLEYDVKVNPLQSRADAVVLGMLDYYSANNEIKTTTISPDFPGPVTSTKTYTYNNQNKPVKGVVSSGGISIIYTYYYQ